MMKPWDCWPVDEGRGDYRTVYALGVLKEAF